jgi:hypothetical protein
MGGEIAAEPAAQYLPHGESWSPRTWKHFRFCVLRHLHDHGAHTLDELAAASPKALFLPLSRSEILAALDSARRRGEVTRLAPGAETARIAPEDEWTVTDSGRKSIRHGLSWMAGTLPRSFGIAIALLTTFGVGKTLTGWLNHSDGATIFVVAEFSIFVLGGLCALLLLLRSRAAGVSARREVSHEWKRWAAARSEWHRIATQRFPWLWLVASVVMFLLGTLAIARFSPLRHLGPQPMRIGHLIVRDPEAPFWVLVREAIALLPFWFTAIPVYRWTQRWNRIEVQARARSAEDAAASVPEMPVLGEDHRDAGELAGLDHVGVALGAAGLDHRVGADVDRRLGPVGEGEEGIGSDG